MIASTAAYSIGLTWGGITDPWGSVTVLVPLILGLIGLGVFIVYDATFAKHPPVRISFVCLDLYLTPRATGTVLPNDK